MAKKVTIEIEGKKYPIKFGYGAFRFLGRMWNCKGITQVIEKLGDLDGMDKDFTFEQADMLADLVLAGVSNASDQGDDLFRDDVMDAILFDPEIMMDVMAELMRSFPQSKPDAKPEKAKKK